MRETAGRNAPKVADGKIDHMTTIWNADWALKELGW